MDRSPLSKLSAELRNAIYELVLVRDAPITLQVNTAKETARVASSSSTQHLLALTGTCREIRNETLPMFLGSNKFKFEPAIACDVWNNTFNVEPHTRAVRGWMKSFHSFADHIRHIEVQIVERAVSISRTRLTCEVLEVLNDEISGADLQLAVTVTNHLGPRRDSPHSLKVDLNQKPDVIMQGFERDCKELQARLDDEIESGKVTEDTLEWIISIVEHMRAGIALVIGVPSWFHPGI